MAETNHPSPRPQTVSVLREAAVDPSAYLAILGIVLFVIAVYGNWSSRGTLQQSEIPIGGNTVQIASSDGMFMVGVFETPNPEQRRPWWFRGNIAPNLGGSLARNMEDPIAFTVTPLGWGFGCRYSIVIFGSLSMPLWWWFVQRTRWERRRQLRDGLCRGCGYDVRMSPIHCPECGRYVGRITTEPLPLPLPQP